MPRQPPVVKRCSSTSAFRIGQTGQDVSIARLCGAVALYAALVVVASPDPAAACSCVGPSGPPPIQFEGIVLADAHPEQVVTFDVGRVSRGRLAAKVDVHIWHNHPSGGSYNTCALTDDVVIGGRYSVGIYESDAGYSASLCAGSWERLDANAEAAATGPPAPAGHGMSWFPVGASVGALSAMFLFGLTQRRRDSAAQ